MNFQTRPVLTPIKVLVVNPLTPAGQLTNVKILSGKVFGEDQLIDLILLVYSNEKPAAESLRLELFGCAYPCYNKIIVSSDLPRYLLTSLVVRLYEDPFLKNEYADVFCFISNFSELNKIDFEKIDSDEQFDALFLIIKVANNLRGLPPKKESDYKLSLKKKPKEPEIIPRKPIIIADGLAALDILKSLSKDIPLDVFFCPTGIPDVAKSVLADFLKVECNEINDVLVWAANDEVLHVEVEKPYIIHDQVNSDSQCDWNMISKDLLRSIDYDHTQFNASWMKKEYIKKVTELTSKNPYGCIYKASVFCNALKSIWRSRRAEIGNKFFCNLGVISDGTLGTSKGYPYILPLVFCGDSWSVNKRYEENAHVMNEIKRINKAVKEQHELLLPYCKKFLQDNVIKQAFIPPSESSADYSLDNSSQYSNNLIP